MEENAIQICVSIKPDLNKQLADESKKTRLPKSRIIAIALEEYLKKQGVK